MSNARKTLSSQSRSCAFLFVLASWLSSCASIHLLPLSSGAISFSHIHIHSSAIFSFCKTANINHDSHTVPIMLMLIPIFNRCECVYVRYDIQTLTCIHIYIVLHDAMCSIQQKLQTKWLVGFALQIKSTRNKKETDRETWAWAWAWARTRSHPSLDPLLIYSEIHRQFYCRID